MGDMLSQAEIDALLGTPSEPEYEPEELPRVTAQHTLTDEEKDILGEVGNISMGTSATTLFALLHQKVDITTPIVSLHTWEEISQSYDRPCVGIRVDYTEGIKGSNVLILKDSDVKVISSLMMGQDGKTGIDEPLNEIDYSAISEAMNQMIGSSSTSLSQLIKMRIDIDTPSAFKLDFNDNEYLNNIGFSANDVLVCVSFRMEIGDLVDSGIMQVVPLEFAVDMVKTMRKEMFDAATKSEASAVDAPFNPASKTMQTAGQIQAQAEISKLTSTATPPPAAPPQGGYSQPMGQQVAQPQVYQGDPSYGYQHQQQQQQFANAKPAQFQAFDMGDLMQQKENIGILNDVPLEVTVELGRTSRKIKEILEFAPSTIIELDKLAGEPIDILVNGKFVAKGEVIVIDENFGIRITDIVSPDKRI